MCAEKAQWFKSITNKKRPQHQPGTGAQGCGESQHC